MCIYIAVQFFTRVDLYLGLGTGCERCEVQGVSKRRSLTLHSIINNNLAIVNMG